MPDGFRIADRARFDRTLDHMARQIVADLGETFQIVGIRRRGVPLAQALAERLADLVGSRLDVGELELKRYADDLTVLHDQPKLGETDLPFEVEGATLLLVDDVLYTGRSMLKAVNHLLAAGAERIYTAALCSRNANDVPVAADCVGMQLDVGSGNVVEVQIPPYEDVWAVVLYHQADIQP